MDEICKKLNITEGWHYADFYDIPMECNMPYSDDIICTLTQPKTQDTYDVMIEKHVIDPKTNQEKIYNICQDELFFYQKRNNNHNTDNLRDDTSFQLFRTIMYHLENFKFYKDLRWPCQCVDSSYEKQNPYTDLATMKEWDELNKEDAENGGEGDEFNSPMAAIYTLATPECTERHGNNYTIYLRDLMDGLAISKLNDNDNNIIAKKLKQAMKTYKAPAGYNVKFI